MAKLRTPVQYESSLAVLNDVRPLILSDTVKQQIDIGVSCINPLCESRPAIGKLIRCDTNGSLLQSDSVGFKNKETIFHVEDPCVALIVVEFSQIVHRVLVWNPIGEPEVGTLTWCTPNEDELLELIGQQWVSIYINSDKIYFLLDCSERTTTIVIGFY